MKNLFIDVGWMFVMMVLIAGSVLLFPFVTGCLILLLMQKKIEECFIPPESGEAVDPQGLPYVWQASAAGGQRLFQAP